MERYFNGYQTTVAPGGYTSGSGVLNVLSTSGITLNAGDTCRLSVYTGSPELVVILIASAVNSGTQFAVTAEGADASASGGDLVLNTLTVGGMDQIRTDISMLGTFANLPVPGVAFLVEGQRYKCTDAPYEFIYNGSAWIPFVNGFECVLPENVFTWANQGGASVSFVSGFAQVSIPGAGSTNLRVQFATQPSTPYTIDVILSADLVTSESDSIGIGFYDGTKLSLMTIFGGTLGSEPGYQQVDYNSVTSFNAANVTLGSISTPFSIAFLRINNDGTNLHFYIGNGYSWYLVRTVAIGSFLTPTDVCYVGNSQDSNPVVFNIISWDQH